METQMKAVLSAQSLKTGLVVIMKDGKIYKYTIK